MQTDCLHCAYWQPDEDNGKGGRKLSFWGLNGMGICTKSFCGATATPAKRQCDLDAFRPSESDTVARRLAALDAAAVKRKKDMKL